MPSRNFSISKTESKIHVLGCYVLDIVEMTLLCVGFFPMHGCSFIRHYQKKNDDNYNCDGFVEAIMSSIRS